MRYNGDRPLKQGRATSAAATRIRKAYNAGSLSTTIVVLGQNNRLDLIAYKYLGDPSMWWAIAALSNIGWGMQLPPGTRLVVPTSRDQVKDMF